MYNQSWGIKGTEKTKFRKPQRMRKGERTPSFANQATPLGGEGSQNIGTLSEKKGRKKRNYVWSSSERVGAVRPEHSRFAMPRYPGVSNTWTGKEKIPKADGHGSKERGEKVKKLKRKTEETLKKGP